MTRPRAARLARGVCFAGLLGLAVLATAGAPSVRRTTGGTVPAKHPPAALVPFENLGGREEDAAIFTKIFFAQIVATGAFDMVDPARVDVAIDSLGIRSTSAMTPADMRALADRLQARYLMVGSVLESSKIQSGTVQVPIVGATLRLIDPTSDRVLWAGVHFRSGEDRESLFGWGRIMSAERLTMELASDMLRDFREAVAREQRAQAKEGMR